MSTKDFLQSAEQSADDLIEHLIAAASAPDYGEYAPLTDLIVDALNLRQRIQEHRRLDELPFDEDRLFED